MSVFSREHPALFVLGLFETNVAAYQLFDQLADLIARALLARGQRERSGRPLRALGGSDRPDLGGGIRYIRSARHVGYIDFGAFEGQIDRVRRHMAWPRTALGHYGDVLDEVGHEHPTAR